MAIKGDPYAVTPFGAQSYAMQRMRWGFILLGIAVYGASRNPALGLRWYHIVPEVIVAGGLIADGFLTWHYRAFKRPRPTLNVPRMLTLSRVLLYFEVHSIWLEAAWYIPAVPLYVELRGPMPDVGWKLLWWAAPTPLVVVIVRFFLVNGTLRVAKRFAALDFTVFVFRRFSPEAAVAMKQVVAPALGCYSRLLAIGDATLSKAENLATADASSIVSDGRDLYPQSEDWNETVRSCLRICDLAVAVVHEDFSSAIEWELNEARAVLPPERILVFVTGSSIRMSSPEALRLMTIVPIAQGTGHIAVGHWLAQHFAGLKLERRQVRSVS